MRKIIALLTAVICMAPMTACLWLPARAAAETINDAEGSGEVIRAEAVYLGVKDYGAESVNKDTKQDFRYRFLIDGEEALFAIDPGPRDAEGAYPIQNALKERYAYRIAVAGDTVVAAEELPGQADGDYVPPVVGTPGERTVANFLKTAMMPVGTALYIYGGGWDWQDVGSAVQTRTLGVSPDWVRFFRAQDENFTYKSRDGDEANSDPANSYYPYGGYNEYYYAGLDCSGYLGWALYNTLETRDGGEGYVMSATRMAKQLSERGFGAWTRDVAVPSGGDDAVMKPGDIMSIDGHVWISLGACDDGSLVILHSTPAASRTGQPGGGVELSAIGASEDCQAYALADRYMSKYYPEWYARYPVKLADPEVYFSFTDEDAGKFSWDTHGAFGDPEGVTDMSPEQALALVFGE